MTFTDLGTFTVISCCECSVPFGMPQPMQTRRKADGARFYCPNGHAQVYCDSEVDVLKSKLKAKENDVQYYVKRNNELYDEKTHVERQLSAKKGQITKIKNRIAKGVCPCCNRSFENLARHMESQHPAFAEAK